MSATTHVEVPVLIVGGGGLIPQDELESILTASARRSPLASVRFSTEMLGFEHDDDRVRVTVRDPAACRGRDEVADLSRRKEDPNESPAGSPSRGRRRANAPSQHHQELRPDRE